MKFTLKNWMRRDKPFGESSSSSPPSPKAKKTDLTLVKVQSHGAHAQRLVLVPFPPSPMSFIDVDPFEKGPEPRSLRQRSKSTSTLSSGKQAPVDARHGPPADLLSRPPNGDMHETTPPSSGFEKTPRRPARPPLSLISSGPVEGSRSSVHNVSDPMVEPDSPTLPSPIRSSFRLRSQRSAASLTCTRLRRPAPELEGVWRDFLQSAGEDMDLFDMRDVTISSSQPDLVQDHTLPMVSPTTPLKTLRKSSRPSAIHASDSEPCQRENLPVNDSGVSLAQMFPAPPPLTIRKRSRGPPAPLQLDRHSPRESQASLPALSPLFGHSSPDLTPIATPTTPRFAQQQRLYTVRQSPSPGYPYTPSFEYTPPPSPRLATPFTQSSEDLPRHQLRNAHSSSHLRYVAKSTKKLAYHRPTSSESSSDHSNCNIPFEKGFCKLPNGEFNYLQSCGRRPSKVSARQTITQQSPVSIEHGLAL